VRQSDIAGTARLWAVALCVVGLFWTVGQQAEAATPEQRAADLVAQMTSAEKVDLVASGTAGVPRLGIPPLSARDGPNGIGTGERGVSAFPNAINIGASWDRGLARQFGEALGQELRAKGFDWFFAPTVEVLRTPLWGRAAETYGEDPFLNGALVAPEISGVQSRHVMAQVKHWVGNTQETGRVGIPLVGPGVDDRVSLRTLNEIYFPGFKSAVRKGGAASVMCSYNRINGLQSCQDPFTLGILRNWLRGFVGPDAVLAVRDGAAAANAGTDNFQIGGSSSFRSAANSGQIPQARIDDAARRILTGMIRVGLLDHSVGGAQPVASTPRHRKLATKISAQASVLLQNRRQVLPFSSRTKSIALIGYDAGPGTQIEEGGSPAVLPGGKVITPLAGISNRAGHGIDVKYAQGTLGVVSLPAVPASVLTPSSGSGQGLSATFFSGRTPDISGAVVGTRVDPTIDSKSVLPSGAGSARWTGTLTPPTTGDYRFSLKVAGNAKLFINGQQIAGGDAEWINLDGGSPTGGVAGTSPGAPDQTFQGIVHLQAGQRVPITVEYAASASITGNELHLGWQPPDPGMLAAAVRTAKHAHVAVVFANDVTGEGMDRTSLGLPGDQDKLISAVAKANPRTVVVLHTASAVLMPWRNKVAGIIEAWYPGQQSGAAIAKTLWGDVDPSGRLPMTFPASDSQGPTANNPSRFPGIGNVVQFSEGLFVGYRWFDRYRKRSLFAFGYGLSYTHFKLGDLNVKKRGRGRYGVSVRVRNTGRRAGAEVVQLYVGFPPKTGEPPRQLKAFGKVRLAPGETRSVQLNLNGSSFRYFNEATNSWKTRGGTYRIYVGTSSRNLPLRARVHIGGRHG
jgi:beta-glucosidase